MCCTKADWKREEVPDHKFDFVDVREFHTTSCFTRLQYAWLYLLLLKSFLVYVFDIYTAVALLASNHWAGDMLKSDKSTAVKVPFTIGKWIFTGCIIFSFLLLAYEARKAHRIIKSRDISYAFTNVMANNYYSVRSYDHFCFFSNINDSKKKKDEFAFFVFFTFKGWKRLLVADAPRQVINALTLYSFARALDFTSDFGRYFEGSLIKKGILISMAFTVIVFAGSAILLAIAAVMYVPLLCYIQGNLKEYCCHKIDKRIAELMKRKTRKRLAKEAALAQAEARGDFAHLKDKKGNLKAKPMDQPTLPNVDLDDFDDGKSSTFHAYPPSSSVSGSGRGGVPPYHPNLPPPPPPPVSDFNSNPNDFYRPRPERAIGESFSSNDAFAVPNGQSAMSLVPNKSERSNGRKTPMDDDQGTGLYWDRPPPPIYSVPSRSHAMTSPQDPYYTNPSSDVTSHSDHSRNAAVFAATQLPPQAMAPPYARSQTPVGYQPPRGPSPPRMPLQYAPASGSGANSGEPGPFDVGMSPANTKNKDRRTSEDYDAAFYEDVYGGNDSTTSFDYGGGGGANQHHNNYQPTFHDDYAAGSARVPAAAPSHNQVLHPQQDSPEQPSYQPIARNRLLERTQPKRATVYSFADSIGAESDFGDYYANQTPDPDQYVSSSAVNEGGLPRQNMYHNR